MQRLCIIFILILGIVHLYTKNQGKKLFLWQLFFAVAGFYFASRQVWLLTLPKDSIPACVPGLTVLIHYFPWKEVANALFWGSGDCTEITWKWLGLSLPMWSALYFLVVGVVSCLPYYWMWIRRVMKHD